MTIKEIEMGRYKLKNPAFAGAEFTNGSDDFLVGPEAVEFGARDGGILQSAREAIAFRREANGKYAADRTQATRTGAIYFEKDGKFYAAFDDSTNPENNIVIARAAQGFEAHKANGRFLLPTTDPLVDRIIKRAQNETGRFAEVPTNYPSELSTERVDGKSQCGQDLRNKAILGDVAESNSNMLNQRGYRVGSIWCLNPEILVRIGVDGNFAEVRHVKLGDGNCDCLGNIYAASQFNYRGRSRGVRHAPEFVAA